jgi:hypothetical protein
VIVRLAASPKTRLSEKPGPRHPHPTDSAVNLASVGAGSGLFDRSLLSLNSRNATPYRVNLVRSSGRFARVARARSDCSRNDPSHSRRSVPPLSTPRADRNRSELQACSARPNDEEPDTSKASRALSARKHRESCSLRHRAARGRFLEPRQNLSSCLAWDTGVIRLTPASPGRALIRK